jgi:hypothetical protein
MQKLMENELVEGMDNNQIAISFVKATTKAMKLTDGDQAMHVTCHNLSPF